jgi:hypothetical protein
MAFWNDINWRIIFSGLQKPLNILVWMDLQETVICLLTITLGSQLTSSKFAKCSLTEHRVTFFSHLREYLKSYVALKNGVF